MTWASPKTVRLKFTNHSRGIMELTKTQERNLVLGGVTAGSVALVAIQPASAQTTTTPVDQVSSLVTSMGVLAGVITTVILGAMGVRMAIKFVNRMTVKG